MTDDPTNADLIAQIKALSERVDELEKQREQALEAFTTIGKWLKSLARNDLMVLEATALLNPMSDRAELREKGKKHVDYLFSFRDDINEKINTDE